MQIQYIGKRASIAQDLCHKRYVFKEENDYVCDVPFEGAVRLIRTGQFIPVEMGGTTVEEGEKEKIENIKKKSKGRPKSK
jgi:hypothetical protein